LALRLEEGMELLSVQMWVPSSAQTLVLARVCELVPALVFELDLPLATEKEPLWAGMWAPTRAVVWAAPLAEGLAEMLGTVLDEDLASRWVCALAESLATALVEEKVLVLAQKLAKAWASLLAAPKALVSVCALAET
jgi:hypothetical protein